MMKEDAAKGFFCVLIAAAVAGSSICAGDSEFCDAAIDTQIARAASLQATDLRAADALWARLDRELTDLTIWLPTVIPNEIDLVSR
jgi:peptide/nickel transport system substrate-binding protein